MDENRLAESEQKFSDSTSVPLTRSGSSSASVPLRTEPYRCEDAVLSMSARLPHFGCRWTCRRCSTCCFHSQVCLDPEQATEVAATDWIKRS